MYAILSNAYAIRQALLTREPRADNQAMLDGRSDAERFGERLKKRARDKKVHPSAIANACGVTVSAVYGWFKTGRVAKRHLVIIAPLLQWTVEDLISENAGLLRQSADEGRNDWSHEAQQLATLFDTLEPAKRRAAWPWVVRMIAQTQGLLELFQSFPTAKDVDARKPEATSGKPRRGV